MAMTDFEAIAEVKLGSCDPVSPQAGWCDEGAQFDEEGHIIGRCPHNRFPWLWKKCPGGHTLAVIQRGENLGRRGALCQEVGCTGYVLIEGRAERWIGLVEVALAIQKAIVVTPHEWDKELPKSWVTVGHFDPVALASAIRKMLGV